MIKSIELLYHFRCQKCEKWWSIADAPPSKKEWFCPWCGVFDIVGNQKQENVEIVSYDSWYVDP